MEDDLSNDVMSIHSNSNDDYTAEEFAQAANDKPLMTLFKRLISNDSKENTVLTNAQIIDILKKEFDMDLSYIHDLEIEIYLNLMKKYLKDWPLWDEFDQSIQELKNRNDTTSIKKKLETNHKNLKDYLSRMLEAAKPFMQNVVDSTKEKVSETDSDVVLEIQCTRQQLNQLFFRRPHPDYNNSIFNVQTPNKITVNNSMSYRSILNWPGIRLNINLGPVSFRRESVHAFKHKLVNKKLNFTQEEHSQINTNLQTKDLRPMTMYTIKHLCSTISNHGKDFSGDNNIVQEISYMICEDFANTQEVCLSPLYRRNLNKYPYIRYLYSEVNTNQPCNSNLYDLQLEETMIPMFTYCIFKYDKLSMPLPKNWLTIDCTLCNVSFNGADTTELWLHFESAHLSEPDYQCTNCKKSFNMISLSENQWKHDCSID